MIMPSGCGFLRIQTLYRLLYEILYESRERNGVERPVASRYCDPGFHSQN